MDGRGKRSRAGTVETRPASHTSSFSGGRRPDLSDKHNSAPVSARQREGYSKRSSGPTTNHDLRQSKKSNIPEENVASVTSDQLRNSKTDSRSSHVRDNEEVSIISLMVIGSRGVGKSSFVRNALDLRKPLTTPSSSSKVNLNGHIYRVQLIELLLDDIDFSSRKVVWPKYLNNSPLPSIDGVFCLYDVTNQDSVAEIPQTLSAISGSNVPCMLVACKTDVPENQRQLSPLFHDQVRRSFSNVKIAETTHEPESPKRCMLSLLNRILDSSRHSNRLASKASIATETDQRVSTKTLSRDTSPEKHQSRSRSNSRLRISKSKEMLLNMPSRAPLIESENEDDSSLDSGRASQAKTKLKLDTSRVIKSPRPNEPHTPSSSGELTSSLLISPSEPSRSAVPETPESWHVKSILRPGTADTSDSRTFQTFLNMDDDPHDDSSAADVEILGVTTSKLKIDQMGKHESGSSFSELVDRLLLLPASKHDSKFVPSFLCLYRAFATPQKLLVAIIDQFVKTDQGKLVHFTKVAEMLRYLQVLAQWTALYPGDFANSAVREIATAFVQSLEKKKVFAPAAREISNNLDTIVQDDDLDWAFDDTASPKEGSKGRKKSSNSTPSSGNTARNTPQSAHWDLDDSDDERDESNSSARDSRATSTASSTMRTANSSSQSFSNLMQLQSAREQADKLKPNPHIRLSKIQWHLFMDTPVEELAREITRIDWAMYSSIRPRDFVRHVMLSTEQKRHCRRSDNISLMVQQFNHLALFVSGMILVRDKPKHRGQCLGKFMALAWKVRQLNNYNSLGAIVAGITGHEIARLNATRDQVVPEVYKQFLRLTILMSHSRSHAAYRMAWDNSFAERIPFLPLLRQDLTMATSVNQTFVGNKINWKKFEIMGDVIVSIQRSLEHPYSFPPRSGRSDDLIKLVLETRVIEEPEDSADPRSELYDRSVQVEPPVGSDNRKKTDWSWRANYLS